MTLTKDRVRYERRASIAEETITEGSITEEIADAQETKKALLSSADTRCRPELSLSLPRVSLLLISTHQCKIHVQENAFNPNFDKKFNFSLTIKQCGPRY